MGARKAFLTNYGGGKGKLSHGDLGYGAEIWARSMKEARRLARRRKIGERVISRGAVLQAASASRTLRSRKATVATKLHSLVWLSYLAMSSGVATVDDILGDENGIIHIFVHHADGITAKNSPGVVTPAELLRKVRALERRVPGYPPVRFGGRSLWSLRRRKAA